MKKRIQQIILLSCILIYDGINQNTICLGQTKKPSVETYTYPRTIPLSNDFSFYANKKEVTVCSTSAGPFAAFSCDGQIDIEIKMPENFDNLSVSPLKHGITPTIDGNIIRFTIPGPMLFAIMDNHTPLLYVYANPFETNVPDASDPGVKYYKAGQVYEVGELTLSSDETLYIEGGAVVRGNVVARSAENVTITGYGVLDGSYYTTSDRHRTIIYDKCKNSVVEKIIMIEPTAWMIVLGACEHIIVRDVKQLGSLMTSDGVDVVGSSHILVENCFFRNCDDCIAIKSFNMQTYEKSVSENWGQDMEDIEVKGCILWSYCGQVFEIGHELTTESVSDIRFIDCDVLVHSYGSVFGIHNADEATISNVLFENIRIEHYYNKLVDFRIIKTKYSGKGVPGRESSRGQIRNVVLRNIDAKTTPFNHGISLSHIGGYDADHTIENVEFDNFRIDGVKITNPDQFDLYIKQASGITFK